MNELDRTKGFSLSGVSSEELRGLISDRVFLEAQSNGDFSVVDRRRGPDLRCRASVHLPDEDARGDLAGMHTVSIEYVQSYGDWGSIVLNPQPSDFFWRALIAFNEKSRVVRLSLNRKDVIALDLETHISTQVDSVDEETKKRLLESVQNAKELVTQAGAIVQLGSRGERVNASGYHVDLTSEATISNLMSTFLITRMRLDDILRAV